MSYTAAVITISDKGYAGLREDTSGPALVQMLKSAEYDVVYTSVVPDEPSDISAELISCCDEKKLDLVLTTGGTGFSPRDITPEVTKNVVERETPGIPELMRAESMKITPNGCLSRSYAGIRGKTLIINLPGSKKASTENFGAVLKPVSHGLEMLASSGSADCAAPEAPSTEKLFKKYAPSLDAMLVEAQKSENADMCGMYLTHVGVVRKTARSVVREGVPSGDVLSLEFSYDAKKVEAAVENAKKLPGIYYAKVWLNEGKLNIGDRIMQVVVGGDIRPHVIDALNTLVGEIKSNCVVEKENI